MRELGDNFLSITFSKLFPRKKQRKDDGRIIVTDRWDQRNEGKQGRKIGSEHTLSRRQK